MSARPSLRPPPGAVFIRLWAFGLAFAVALAALAAVAANEDGPALPRALGAQAQGQAAGRAMPGLAAWAPSPSPALGPDAAPDAAAVVPRRVPPDPPPFAPGGDDVVPWPELVASSGWRQTRAPRETPPPQGALRAAAAWALPVVALPSLRVWLDPPRAQADERVVLHVASVGAHRCTVMGAWPTARVESARVVMGPFAPGRHSLTVACQGPGGSVAREATLAVPLPVLPSSLENAAQWPGDIGTAGLPGLAEASAHRLRPSPDPRAVGDFFQEGRLALFGVVRGPDGHPEAGFASPDGQGGWQDRSVELLTGRVDRRLCPGLMRALTADFNGDGKPDVLVACSAAPAAPGDGAAACCRQIVFLSQADGLYARLDAAWPLAPEGLEAQDLDGDRLIDIIAMGVAAGLGPRVLLGRGDGSFYSPR